MTSFLVPISPGELIDKITILEIKSERITHPEKVENVRRELNALIAIWSESVEEDATLTELRQELRTINEALWEIEEHIREEDRSGQFGERFVELARAVYQTNDRRSQLKREVNLRLGSSLFEEKSHDDAE